MNATEQNFPLVQIIILYTEVALITFEFGHEILKCDYSNKSY